METGIYSERDARASADDPHRNLFAEWSIMSQMRTSTAGYSSDMSKAGTVKYLCAFPGGADPVSLHVRKIELTFVSPARPHVAD